MALASCASIVGYEISAVKRKWTGILWYSFYERGADMGDFCAHALAVVTGRQVGDFRSRKTADLAAELIPLLKKGRFLLVLDGLERVLVAYNRYDAAHMTDEDLQMAVGSLTSKAQECIRAADSFLLRALTRVTPTRSWFRRVRCLRRFSTMRASHNLEWPTFP